MNFEWIISITKLFACNANIRSNSLRIDPADLRNRSDPQVSIDGAPQVGFGYGAFLPNFK
jgi:hypothetical protein